MDDSRLTHLVNEFQAGRIDRRQLLRRAVAAGLSAPAVGLLLGQGANAASPAKVIALAAAPNRQVDATTLVIADNMSSGGLWLSLDPGRFYEVNPGPLMNLVYEPLYHLPDSSQPDVFEPLLASDMPEISTDGLEATVRLREGVTFQSTGNPMTADDVVYSLNRTRTLKDNPSYLAEYWDSVEAVDPLTVKFTLPAPNPALVAILTSTPLAVMDSVAVTEQGGTGVAATEEGSEATPGAGEPDSATEWLNENSAGTGPFMISQWDPNGEVIVERNPDYWGVPPALDRVIWRNVVDANTQLQAIQTGEADIAFAIDPDAVSQVEEDDTLQLLSGESISFEYLAMHNAEEPGGPLAVKELRQAIAYAIDYDGIIDSLLTGAAVRPATIVPLPMPGSETVQADAYQTDLARAQELFDGTGLGEVEITLSYRADGQGQGGVDEETLATKLQSDLQQINGLTVTLAPTDANTWIADFRASQLQCTLAPWGPDYPDIQSYVEPFGRTGEGVAQRVGYSNATVDETLDQIVVETDDAAKEELYTTVQRTLIDDVPYVVLFQPTERKPARAVVEGVTVHYLYGLQLRYASKTA
ncbi:MAG: ABC transporter substrate-binding protein [Chloroflexota bacterium]|nr:ABC transporter substrate-binding protein [Chloroflexota bacterium]